MHRFFGFGTLVLLLSLIGGTTLCAQEALHIAHRKRDKQIALDPARILTVWTGQSGIPGVATLQPDSVLQIKMVYYRDSEPRDTTRYIPWEKIEAITYCKARKIEKCPKRRNGRWAQRWINSVTAGLTAVGLFGMLFQPRLALIGIVGGAAFFTIANLATEQKTYIFTRKWRIIDPTH